MMGLMSQTVDQQYTNIASTHRVFWDVYTVTCGHMISQESESFLPLYDTIIDWTQSIFKVVISDNSM